MRIDGLGPDPAFYREYRNDLELLLRQAGDHDARPCPGCTIRCPKCGSHSCTCNCTSACDVAPRMMSSDPDDHPVESGIVPLVYAFYSLRLTPPCWSCEGPYTGEPMNGLA